PPIILSLCRDRDDPRDRRARGGSRDGHGRLGGVGGGRSLGHHADRIEVEVLLVGNDAEDVWAGGERDAADAEPLEGAPPAGAGYGGGTGHVDAVDFGVPAAGGVLATHAGLEAVGARLG